MDNKNITTLLYTLDLLKEKLFESNNKQEETITRRNIDVTMNLLSLEMI